MKFGITGFKYSGPAPGLFRFESMVNSLVRIYQHRNINPALHEAAALPGKGSAAMPLN